MSVNGSGGVPSSLGPRQLLGVLAFLLVAAVVIAGFGLGDAAVAGEGRGSWSSEPAARVVAELPVVAPVPLRAPVSDSGGPVPALVIRCLWPNGAPIPGVQVFQARGEEFRRRLPLAELRPFAQRTDGEGRLSLAGEALAFGGAVPRPLLLAWAGRRFEWLTAPDLGVENIVVFADPVTVRAVVCTPAGDPIAGAVVILSGWALDRDAYDSVIAADQGQDMAPGLVRRDRLQVGRTDARGQAEIQLQRSGHHHVGFWHETYLWLPPRGIAAGMDLVAGQTIELVADEPYGVALQLPPGEFLSARARFGSGLAAVTPVNEWAWVAIIARFRERMTGADHVQVAPLRPPLVDPFLYARLLTRSAGWIQVDARMRPLSRIEAPLFVPVEVPAGGPVVALSEVTVGFHDISGATFGAGEEVLLVRRAPLPGDPEPPRFVVRVGQPAPIPAGEYRVEDLRQKFSALTGSLAEATHSVSGERSRIAVHVPVSVCRLALNVRGESSERVLHLYMRVLSQPGGKPWHFSLPNRDPAIYLPVGVHDIEMRLSGYLPTRHSVVLQGGEQVLAVRPVRGG